MHGFNLFVLNYVTRLSLCRTIGQICGVPLIHARHWSMLDLLGMVESGFVELINCFSGALFTSFSVLHSVK
jgi:hypothetical protein